MTIPYEIPLSAVPQRRAVSLAGTVYQLVVQWNPVSAAWVIDLNSAAGDAIVAGLPLMTGVNLLSPFAYLALGGALYVQVDSGGDSVPTYANLGSAARVYWVPA
jgi:hypothetical protein